MANILQIPDMQQMVKDNTIVSHYSGSIAYGTNLPTSDIDIRGIFIADKLFRLTPWFTIGESSIANEDTKFYEIHKFMDLLVKQNPNIVESLWVDDSDIIEQTPIYSMLRSYRSELLSSKCAFTYSGYAYAQLKRIKGHNLWINNPKPKDPPRQIDYISLIQDFSADKFFKFTGDDMQRFNVNHRLIPYGNNIFGLYEVKGSKLFDDIYTLNTNNDCERPDGIPIRILKFNIEQYRYDKDEHHNYWQWKNNRNHNRSALEEQFGYDTKHAMHLIRLFRTGLEILTEEQVNVKRNDANELLDIRNGKYTYEDILEQVESLDDQLKQAYKKTQLQRSVDLKRAGRILIDIQESFWDGQ